MKLFYVISSSDHRISPQIVLEQKEAISKTNQFETLKYKTFENEIEAETWLFTQKIAYLIKKQEMSVVAEEVQEVFAGSENEKRDEREGKVNFFPFLCESDKKIVLEQYNAILVYQKWDKDYFVPSKIMIPLKKCKQFRGYFDGCSKGNPGPSGIGYLIKNEDRSKILEQGLSIGTKTNNQAEFLALICLLLDCIAHKIDQIQIFGDSQFVIKAVRGEYRIKKPDLIPKLTFVQELLKSFKKAQMNHIPRHQNKQADTLSNLGLKKHNLQKQ